MKKTYTHLLTLCCLLAFYLPANARHCAGGELVYKWIADSTYRVTFKFYYFCNDQTAAPADVEMCYGNSCTNYNNSIRLLKTATLPDGSLNGAEVSTGCGGYPSKCISPNSTLDGYREYYYESDVTLPARCNEWRFSVSISSRNSSVNLNGGTGNVFFIQTTLNNALAQGNSSPTFSVKPVPFVCINNPYTYNNGVFDADGDSLAYELLQPTTGGCGSPGSPINFSSPTYNIINNPFATGNTFSLNPITGQLNFTPTITGPNTLTLNVKEYRHGVQIGSAMRDIQVQILPCNSVQPTFIPDTLNIAGGSMVNGRIEDCAGTPLNFCFKVKSPNAGAILVASDNHSVIAPGSVVTYTGQRTDSILGCFSWTPSALDTGLRNFAITLKDSTCLPPGVAVSQTFVIPIYIYSVTWISKDSTICAGTSVPLIATGGTGFTWSVLPGGAPLSTLSCTNCYNPIATPLVTTRYVVVSNLTSYCNKKTDTVLITVNQLPAAPVIISNSPVCVGDSLKISTNATASTYAWTGPAGFHSNTKSPLIANAQLPNSGVYALYVKNGQCISPPSTATITISATPRMPVISGDSIGCEGNPLQLTASSNGSIFRWTGPNNFAISTPTLQLNSAQVIQSGIYEVRAYSSRSYSCPSPAKTINVTIAPAVDASFNISQTDICVGDAVSLNSTGNQTPISNRNWQLDGGVLESGTGAGPYVARYTKDGVKRIVLTVSNVGCTDSMKKTVNVHSLPLSDFTLQQEACLDEPVRIKTKEKVSVDLQFSWNFADANVLDGQNYGPYHLSFPTPGYKVISLLTESEFCQSVLTTDTIFVHPSPEAKILSASQNNICSGELVRFTAKEKEAYNYQWAPQQYFGSNSPIADAKVDATGYVTLTVLDSLGCTAQDSIMIITKPCCTVTMPNAFTPNNDGRNDVFRVVTIGHPLSMTFRIFNRWGEPIFSTGDQGIGWNGSSNGKMMDAGTYYYYVKYQCSDKQFYELKGEVILIR